MFKQAKIPPPDARILKMRDQETANREMCKHVESLNAKLHVANWEQKTDSKIRDNLILERYEEMKAQAEEQLDVRRGKLARKLYDEHIGLQMELQSQQETPDERRDKMVARAKELYSQRENERQALADEMLYRHWRESCDTLRVTDSKKVRQMTEAGRRQQEDEKKVLKQQELEEKRLYDEMYEHERQKKELRHLADVKRRKERDSEAVRVLNEQIEENRVRTEEANDEKRRDVDEMKARWREEESQAKAEEEARYERNRQVGEELLRFNIQKQEEQMEADMKERDYDKRLVDQAVRKAKEEEDRETEAKAKAKMEARMYRQHLLIMMQKEAESMEERDRLIKMEEDKAWAKRQAQHDKEQAAREALMKNVLETRDAQLKEKEDHAQFAAAEARNERQKMLQEMERIEFAEQQYSAHLKEERVKNRLDIEAQMRQKENLRMKEKLEAERDFAGGQRAESIYTGMISTDNQPPAMSFGRKATKWYN
mmetsp:Transcript_41577/g.50428  ORF Transcript_41577/g.50428 Transcript_41577/m.50428 type:complete len:485 (-) Transcript_41577:1044-2498(-)|eukprot:CAMPEP_0197866380 /NCGR_PEP_ID=MMETSP1438-20131217/44185_1 /TAXON_ID=1461541 /ORGANISM="Pterosperma sp., Strain CCMP1384" /LENGTH=484 /DNA_ID=CAMNT_0043484945 /DNA_START=204 /DNA_END=1658 /DNA_ORIENTATION=-